MKILKEKGSNIECCGTPIKLFKIHAQCYLLLNPVFYVLSMNRQKLLHPLINHMYEVLQQVNHEEYSKKL